MKNKLETIKGKPNILLIAQDGTIQLADYGTVLGVSIEVTDDSPNDAKFQYDSSPFIKLKAGAAARNLGGFYGQLPVSYDGEINIKFDAANPLNEVILIITAIQCNDED